MRKKKVLFYTNILLAFIIAFIAFIKIHKIKVLFDCEYGNRPEELLKVAGENFPDIKEKKPKAIYIFNNLPDIAILYSIEKLHYLYKEWVSFGIIFTKKFRSKYDFGFPYKILSRYKFSCKNNKDTGFEKNYFLFISKKEIVHNDNNFDFFDMNFIIQKKLNPDLNYMNAQISVDELKSKIIQRMNGKELELLNINTNTLEKFGSFSEFSKIYFFHANCSSCQLKSLIKDMQLKRIFNEEKILVIFSIFANRFELQSILEQNKVNFPIYIDNRDQFLLHSKITNEKKNPVIITEEELRSLL
jgi:hypothetical protein